jgi:type IV pilus assembly protein PilA
MKNKKKKKGFTLIELIIVIAILAILAALALPKFGAVKNTANISADKATAKNIQTTISKQIAEDTITLGTVVTNGDLPATVTNAIDGNLTPKLKAFDSGSFVYSLTAGGDITISVKPGTGDTGTLTEVFPTPAGDYAK